MSTLTGESVPVERSQREPVDTGAPLLQARDLVLSGTTCTEGEAPGHRLRDRDAHRARPDRQPLGAGRRPTSRPLESQVRKVAWLIAAVAVVGRRRVHPGRHPRRPGLSLADAVVFAVGLLVGLVPEGAAAGDHPGAGGRRPRARPPRRGGQAAERGRDAGLDERHLHRQDRHPDREPDARDGRLDAAAELGTSPASSPGPGRGRRRTASAGGGRRDCNNAAPRRRPAASRRATRPRSRCSRWPRALGADADAGATRAASRRASSTSTRTLKLMSTVDDARRRPSDLDQGRARGRASALHRRSPGRTGRDPLDAEARTAVDRRRSPATPGAGCASSAVASAQPRPTTRSRPSASEAERDLCLLGLVAMSDPPRARGRRRRRPTAAGPGSGSIVITGDHGLTATAIARDVGIVTGEPDRRSTATTSTG